MVYPTLFDTDVSKKVINRRQIQQAEVDEKFEPLVQVLIFYTLFLLTIELCNVDDECYSRRIY